MRLLQFVPRALPLALLLLGVAPSWGQPALSVAVPSAVAPGKATDVVLQGVKLDPPIKIWSSFPAQIDLAPGDPNQKGKGQLPCKITLPTDAACGVGCLMVATAEGVSDPLFVMIDDLPSVADNGNNHTREAPQELTLPTAVDGTSDGTVFDFYKFTAKASQRLSLEVVSARIGSEFDPVLRLLNAAGQELAIADDDPGLGADCRLSHTFAADGVYLLELRDNRYKPGGRYRLRIGDFPLLNTAFPLGIRQGGAQQMAATGLLADGIVPTIFASPAGVPGGRLLFSAKLPGGQSSGFAPVIVSDLAEFIENAPADKPDAATALTSIPCAVSGKLEAAKDQDHFTFPAAKDMRVTCKAFSRSLGSPAVLAMRLFNAANGQVAETAPTEADEEAVSLVIPETGVYRLAVEDLLQRGGPDYAYRVEIRTGNSFTLNLKPDKAATRSKVSLPKNGGAFTLDVQVVRNGYDGPIKLEVGGPRTGWQLFGNVIPEKAAETKVYLIAPPDLQEAEIVPLRIVGKAYLDGREFTAEAGSTGLLRANRPQQAYPPGWLEGLVAVSGLADKPAYFQLSAAANEATFPRLVGQGQWTLTMDRTDPNFKDVPLTVIPLGLPAGISAEIKRNGAGPKETYDIILKGPKDLPEGRHLFRYLAYAELAGNGRAVVSGEIPLNIITPLAATVAPAGPLVVGQKVKVKVTLTRRGDDKQPVIVKWKKLPAGVTGPETTTFAADQSEMELELTAAADAAKGNFTELAVVAATKYTAQDITVDSPNVPLEVKAP